MDKSRRYGLLLFLLAVALCFVGNHALLVTDPVESNYAETAVEMIRSGDLFSPRIFGHYWYDKPIFYYWQLIASYKIFGINSFAARFPQGICGVLSVMLTYWFVRRLYDERRGFVAGVILATSIEFFYISRAIITDMTLFLFFNFTLMALWIAYTENKKSWCYAAYVGAALGTLTKGPIGLVLPGLIFLFFLAWRHDLKAMKRMKFFSGLLLYIVICAVWYGPMVMLHDGDFLLNFFGVHNVLRATVSEHPKQNVWYYYILMFLAGCAPWSFTLPLAGHTRSLKNNLKTLWETVKRNRWLPDCDVRTQFFVSWAFIVVLFFQIVQTKYMTYTFPYMVPLAVGFSSYLQNHTRVVRWTAGVTTVMILALTWFVAIPACRKASAYDAAQTIRKYHSDGLKVVTYGGRYPVSLTYYSGVPADRLKRAADIPGILPGTLSWNAKNMMPFRAIEDVPELSGRVLAVVNHSDQQSFLKDVEGPWEFVSDNGKWIIFEKLTPEDPDYEEDLRELANARQKNKIRLADD
ncbi:MAG: glycosyltransferase family 39 protein [Acidaminococcus sp.]|jgi:4-amino-4-deoxy-L-arabinose transferase-like glycosyltransferase|nr:glycosyltransferase family 39 protein [Acidaminococcus sp.]MCI2114222.1 glycosyltransferase family 39 protein [Acidaminococcus sp.]MCI2116157.1 glycosyltransferase family 39 protein [Acidaminococcus sp.]